MDIRAKLTVIGFFSAALFFFGKDIWWGYAVSLWLFLLFSLAAALIIESKDRHRPRLKKLFLPRRANSLCRRLLWKPAHWPRDWRMFDWALRVALFYTIALPFLVWFWSGHAITIGAVTVLPEQTNIWRRSLLIASFAFAIALPLQGFRRASLRQWIFALFCFALWIALETSFGALHKQFARPFALFSIASLAIILVATLRSKSAGLMAFGLSIGLVCVASGDTLLSLNSAVANLLALPILLGFLATKRNRVVHI